MIGSNGPTVFKIIIGQERKWCHFHSDGSCGPSTDD